MSSALPTPHLEKINAVLSNAKLPGGDRPRIEAMRTRYLEWRAGLMKVEVEDLSARIATMVMQLNEYRNYVDLEVIFDSENDFLYRQKGQCKLDNSVIEEFLPILAYKCALEEIDDDTIIVGPKNAFSAIYFRSTLDTMRVGGGLHVRTKDQDFAIARRIHLKTSYEQDFATSEYAQFYLAYVAAECKTNLDKTMFQEAAATARDVKAALVGSRYFLICEWLDMTPESTSATDIDEVLLLRKAKRLSSNIRGNYGTATGRQAGRDAFVAFLNAHPFAPDVFERLITHIKGLLMVDDPQEKDVLKDGFF